MKFLLAGVLLLARTPQGSVERGRKLFQDQDGFLLADLMRIF